jgi:hypothetical protein
VSWAAEREILVVAGANQAFKYRRRILLGRGTRGRPFQGTQSIEAALALLELTDTGRRTIHGWGYGGAVDPDRVYFYRAKSGEIYELRFLSREGIGNAFNYSEAAARADAHRLGRAVASSERIAGRPVIFVGCSWGAAVIDYGLTHPAEGPVLPGPGIAIGGPRLLLAPSFRRPLRTCVLSANGDHGQLWVQRHPKDPIGRDGFAPLLYFRNRSLHDYTVRSARSEGAGVWGINGERN